MWETKTQQVHTAVEAVVREIEAGEKLGFGRSQADNILVSLEILPYRTLGVSGKIPVQDEQGQTHILAVSYLKVIGNWYRVNYDSTFMESQKASVDLITGVSSEGLFPTEDIGWIRQKENGLYDYYSKRRDKVFENYEHPDLTETIMKLAVTHQAEVNKR